MRAARVIPLMLLLTACSTAGDYSCPAPDGVTCKSTSQNYEDTHNKLGSKNKESATAEAEKGKEGEGAYRPSLAASAPVPIPRLKPGEPLRLEPRILRVWVGPWEDADGTFHDQSYTYVVVDEGRWLLSQNRRQIEGSWRLKHTVAPKSQPSALADDGKPPVTKEAQPARSKANEATIQLLESATKAVNP
jgi:conjugal transfer pilus assembly protein TraV